MEDNDETRELFILDVLRRLARQRVAAISRDGYWMIERGIEHSPEIDEAIRTCHMRGWVDVLADAVPTTTETSHGTSDKGRQPVYRLTDAGWNAINRKHQMDVFSLVIAFTSLLVSGAGLIVSLIAILK